MKIVPRVCLYQRRAELRVHSSLNRETQQLVKVPRMTSKLSLQKINSGCCLPASDESMGVHTQYAIRPRPHFYIFNAKTQEVETPSLALVQGS